MRRTGFTVLDTDPPIQAATAIDISLQCKPGLIGAKFQRHKKRGVNHHLLTGKSITV
jgi:hypothetical protein